MAIALQKTGVETRRAASPFPRLADSSPRKTYGRVILSGFIS